MFKLIGEATTGLGKLVSAFSIGCGVVEKVAITADKSVDLVNEQVQQAISEAAAERENDNKDKRAQLEAQLAALKAEENKK